MSLFDELVTQALRSDAALGLVRPAVEKELLHHDILREMAHAGLLPGLVFIGGTCTLKADTSLQLPTACCIVVCWNERVAYGCNAGVAMGIYLTCRECGTTSELRDPGQSAGAPCPHCGAEVFPDIDGQCQGGAGSETPEVARQHPDIQHRDSASHPGQTLEMDFSKPGRTVSSFMRDHGIVGGVTLDSDSVGDNANLLVGHEDERYRIGRLVARGGMGGIFLTRDINCRRNVAMKVLLEGKTAGLNKTARFIEEAQITAQLEHPGIVPVYEVGVDLCQNVYYTMKLVQGETLGDILKGLRSGNPDAAAKYPLEHLLTILMKICDAVAYAHSRGVVHRDLKPANVMVGEYGEVLVMDWGLAKVLRTGDAGENSQAPDRDMAAAALVASLRTEHPEQYGVTMDGQVMGTPHYMAPEQARGRNDEIDQRTDVYALGAMLYAILTLRPPVDGGGNEEILRHVVAGKVTAPADFNRSKSDQRRNRAHRGHAGATAGQANARDGHFPHCPGGRVPSALSSVAMRALSTSPQDRYASVIDLQRDIAAYQRGFATSAEVAGLGRQAVLLFNRHRKEAGLLAASLLVILTVTGASIHRIASEQAATRRQERLATLTQAFQLGLDAAEWDVERLVAMEKLAATLEDLSPDRSASAAVRLYERYAAVVHNQLLQPRLTDSDLAAVLARIEPLDTRAPARAAELRRTHTQRLRNWEQVFSLDPPFTALADVLPEPGIVKETQYLEMKSDWRQAAPDRPYALRVLPFSCIGNVQMQATFLHPTTTRFGLLLNAGVPSAQPQTVPSDAPIETAFQGYGFFIEPYLPPGAPRDQTPLRAVMRIWRDNVILQERIIAYSDSEATFDMSVARRGQQLWFRVNNEEAMAYEDVFPLIAPGNFALWWPNGAKLTRLSASSQRLGDIALPLERGDDLYSRGRYDRALLFFREQALTTSCETVAAEARYKEGMCLAAVGRQEEAAEVFRLILPNTHLRWSALAACQLWMLGLQSGGITEAEAFVDHLEAVGISVDDLLQILPTSLVQQVHADIMKSAQGINYALNQSPETIHQLRQLSRFEKALGLDYIHSTVSLSRSYWLQGDVDEALRVAKELSDQPPKEFSATASLQYVWMLRALGRQEEALQVLEQSMARVVDAKGDEDVGNYLVARARTLASLERYQEAEVDIKKFLNLDRDFLDGHIEGRFTRGMILKVRGNQAAAEEIWGETYRHARDVAQQHALTAGGEPRTYLWKPPVSKNLELWIMGALSGEMPLSDVLDMIRMHGPPDSVRLTDMISPEYFRMLRDIWRCPDGHDLARRIAFGQLSPGEFVEELPVLAVSHIVGEVAFQGAMNQAEKELLRAVVCDVSGAMQAGRLGVAQLILLLSAWKGQTGFLGWGQLAASLEPSIRAPVAYVLANRYRHLPGKSARDVETLLNAAVRDGGEDSAVVRLARGKLREVTAGLPTPEARSQQ